MPTIMVQLFTSMLKEGPQELNFWGVNALKLELTAHSVVAQRLLQDRENPNIYYLEIYDSNYPFDKDLNYHREYVVIEKYFINQNTTPSYKYDTVDYTFDSVFAVTDIRKLEEYIKNHWFYIKANDAVTKLIFSFVTAFFYDNIT